MRHLLITCAALCAALTSTADIVSFSWEGVPYTQLNQHTTLTIDGLQISFGGDGWLNYQQTGQLAFLPSAHGDIATLTFTWAEPVQDVSIALAGLMRGNFTHAIKAAFVLGSTAVEHAATNLHSVQEQGGWLSNVVQWSHDGSATLVASGVVDRVTLSFITQPGTSTAAPYYSTVLLPLITWATPIPESAHVAWLIAGGLCGLLIARGIIRRYR